MIYIRLSAAVFFWAITFVYTKIALQECNLTTLVFVRSFLGLLMVTLFLREFAWLKDLKKKDWLKLVFLSVVGVIIQQFAQGYGVLHTSTNHAGWLVALSPVFVALIMVTFFGEHLPAGKMAGFAVCILGVLLIFFSKQALVGGGTMHTSKGDLIFVMTSLNWVLYVVPMSIWFKNMPNLRVTFCIFLIACLILLPVEIATASYKNFANMHIKSVLSLLYLGICCSGFAFIFYNEGVEKLGAATASAFVYAQPLVTMVFSYFVMGEVIGKEAFVGGAFIMFGLYLINVRMHHVKKFYITLIRYFRV